MPDKTLVRSHTFLLWGMAAILLALSAPAARAQGLEACSPAPAVKTALEQLPQQTPAQTEWQFHEQQASAFQALLRQYPGDLFVQRRYIRSMWSPEDKDEVIKQYKTLEEQNPGDPKSLYLYGLALLGRHSPESIKLFERALEKSPQFAWPHLELVRIFSAPNFPDKEKAAAHLKSFLELCPSAFEGYSSLERTDDKGEIRHSAEKLRKMLQSRSDAEAVGNYTTLWSLEFKARPPAEYDALRKQVGQDLARIRALNMQDKREWYEVLQEGYKLVNDQKQSDWAKAERARRFPDYWELTDAEQWRKEHPWPGRDDPAEKKRAFYIELLKKTDQWTKERPNLTYVWFQRLEAMNHLDYVSSADIEAMADKALKVAESNSGPRGPDSGVYFTIAETLSTRNIQPERVLELGQRGLAKWEVESKQPPYDLYATKDETEDQKFWTAFERTHGLSLASDSLLRLKQPEKAKLELAQLDEKLQDLKSLAGDKEDRRKQHLSAESGYWGLMARLAEMQNRKLDAIAFYESGLLARFAAEEKPETGRPDELAEGAKKLWVSLGGTEDGWNTWYVRRASALEAKAGLTWRAANEPLPSFELVDLQGKTWRPADLRGKVTLLNVWASW